MAQHVIDDVIVYEGDFEGDYIAYFDDWLEANGHYKREAIRDRMLSAGEDEEAFDEIIEELEEEFFSWCEDNDVDGQTV